MRFIVTKEHRRFTEFADAVRRHRYIGLCYGPAGVGKTLSARRYAHWDNAEPLLTTWGPREDSDTAVYAALARARTVFFTPRVTATLRQTSEELTTLTNRVTIGINEHLGGGSGSPGKHRGQAHAELLIVDESERLSPIGLEHLRDCYDRTGSGLILIGMPGMEKRLARYPQLYSRVGFAHHYRPLTGDELTFVLTRHWRDLGLDLDTADFTDTQAIAAIARHHQRQLPVAEPPVHPDRAHHADQRTHRRHQQHRRSRPQHPGHRRHLIPIQPRHLPMEITLHGRPR